MLVECPVSLGELVDKLTILEIKKIKIEDKQKVEHVENERKHLSSLLESLDLQGVDELKEELKNINLTLWQIEDDIRDLEAVQNFNEEFVDLARSVYKTNDQRFLVKKKINEKFGSNIHEVKSYKNY